jgi:hypothetical protein
VPIDCGKAAGKTKPRSSELNRGNSISSNRLVTA